MGASTDRSKKAKKYREAAARVLSRRVGFVCYALKNEALCAEVRDVFYTPENDGRLAWMSGLGGPDEEGAERTFYDKAELNGRSLALCFMAAMVEAGDA